MTTIRDIQSALIADCRGIESNTELYEKVDRTVIRLQLVVEYEPLPAYTPSKLYGNIARKTVRETN